MTKAEERALEAYPYDYPERTGFRQGYEQAEKDLASELQRRHDGYKAALEKEKDPRSKYAIDLIARIREDSRLIELINFLPDEEPSKELEEEINKYFYPLHPSDIQFEPFTQMEKCARHFAEWGAKSVFNGDIKFR